MTGIKVITRKNIDEIRFEKIKEDALKKKQRVRIQLLIDARQVIKELELTDFSNYKDLNFLKSNLIKLINKFKEEKFNNINSKEIQKLKDMFRKLRFLATEQKVPLTNKSTPSYRTMTAHAYRIALLNEEIKNDIYVKNLSFKHTLREVLGLNKRWRDPAMITMMFIAFPVTIMVALTKYILDISTDAMVLEVERREDFEEIIKEMKKHK